MRGTGLPLKHSQTTRQPHLRLDTGSPCCPQVAHGRSHISVTQPPLHGLKVNTGLETRGKRWPSVQSVPPSTSRCAAWGAGDGLPSRRRDDFRHGRRQVAQVALTLDVDVIESATLSLLIFRMVFWRRFFWVGLSGPGCGCRFCRG
jgi:hypothetical protein